MSQSKATKDRVCDHCKGTYRVTAKEIKAHAVVCQRAKAAGIITLGGVTLK